METYLVTEAFAARLRRAVAVARDEGDVGATVAGWPVLAEMAEPHEPQDCFFVELMRAQEAVQGNHTWRVELAMGCQVVGQHRSYNETVALLGEGCAAVMSLLRGDWTRVALDGDGCPATVLELKDELMPPEFGERTARYRIGVRAYLQF